MTDNANLYALFRRHFPADPGACCLELPDGRGLGYGEVDAQSGRMAQLLVDLGVQPGDRVLVQVDKSPEAVLLYLGCLRAGAVFLPLNTAYTAREVDYFITDAEPRVAVCRPQERAALAALADAAGVAHLLTLDGQGGGTLMERFAGAADSDLVLPRAADDLAAILYTSGTTGRSKGAMLSHANLASNAQVLHDYWGWVPGDVLIHALPIFHVHGLFVALHTALLNGSRMLWLPKFDADAIVARLPRATVLMGVPTFYVRLLEHPGLTRDAVANMRLFVAGSAPLLAETFTAFEQVTGHRILERYGMTEAGMITSNPYSGERLPGTVGFFLPGTTGRVADDAGNEVPRGTAGVLEIKGPNVFQGYWRMPEKTAEEFRADGHFITGDIATMAADGRISIVGRAKDLIISGGYNIYPKEIELLIDDLPGVKESAVIGVPHPDFGEGVTAVVVRDGSAEIDEQGVLDALAGELARFKQPKRVYFVDELPRNTMGKVQKNQLREAYQGTFAG
ncbi:MAG TPA: malonyl-CoA synthase [Gammaproteobacteria bacterium]